MNTIKKEFVRYVGVGGVAFGADFSLFAALNLAGMVCFGRDVWQRHADVFALYFSTLGRLAPIQFTAQFLAFANVHKDSPL